MSRSSQEQLEATRHSTRLQKGQIGPFGLAALAIGVVSPALGLFALWGPIQAVTGPISPLVFLGAAALALPTAISYAVMNREAPSAGAASTWLWRTVSPHVGYLVGLTMLTYFILVVLNMLVLFTVFFRDLLGFFGVPDFGLATLIIAMPIVTLPVMWAAYRGAQSSTRSAVVLMTIESVVVIALAVTILYVKSAVPGGIHWGPFIPSAATHGFTGYWLAMLLGVLAYCGFDIVSTAAEEANAPREHVPKAILITIVGVTLFWALNGWAFTLGIPHEKVVEYSAQGQSAVTPMAELYWGRGSLLTILAALTGIVAVYITAALGTSRIIFALARHGLLPRFFAKLEGPRCVPKRALHFVFSFAIVANIAILLVLRNGITAFTWWSNTMVFFATFTFAAVNVANLVYFRRFARDRFHPFFNGVVPVIGVVLTVYVAYEMFFVALWNAGFTTGRSVVLVSVILFCIYAFSAVVMGITSPQRLQGAAPIEADNSSPSRVH